MKTKNMFKYISISIIILTIVGALLKTGGEGTAVIVVLISSLIFIAASIKTNNNES